MPQDRLSHAALIYMLSGYHNNSYGFNSSPPITLAWSVLRP